MWEEPGRETRIAGGKDHAATLPRHLWQPLARSPWDETPLGDQIAILLVDLDAASGAHPWYRIGATSHPCYLRFGEPPINRAPALEVVPGLHATAERQASRSTRGEFAPLYAKAAAKQSPPRS